MSKSPQSESVWERKYLSGHRQLYPWDAIVSFVFRNAPVGRPRGDVNIIEVGCGTGANLWFCSREGFRVSGVDASPSAIAGVQARFAAEGLEGDFRVGDFTKLPHRDKTFDLALDRGALTCGGRATVVAALAEIRRVLRPGGRFFFNPYSDRHTSAKSGVALADGRIDDIRSGTMVGVGPVGFFDRAAIDDLIQGWRLLQMQHVELVDMTAEEETTHAEWRIVLAAP